VSLRILIIAACVLALSTVAGAQGPVAIGMTELPTQPCNGLSVQGVTFQYVGPYCLYNTYNGGTLTYLGDPTIRGEVAGTLTMTLSAPTTYLQFGVSLSSGLTVMGAVLVQLLDPSGNPLGAPISLDTRNITGAYTEGLFVSNQEDKLIGGARITFPNTGGASEFAIDNIVYTPFDGFFRFFY
jgi:hypothetical protein